MTVKKDVQDIINLSIQIIKSNPYSKARKLIRSIEVNGRKIPVNLANKAKRALDKAIEESIDLSQARMLYLDAKESS